MTATSEERPREVPSDGIQRSYLDAYLKRIQYSGARSPTLATLKSIHLLHPQHIPFENLNPLLRIPVKLDLASVVNKMILDRRGGYCFEHNLILKTILEWLGFKVKGLGARVVWNQPADAITARGHMLLLIDLEGVRYIADVGFGGMTLTSPLELKAGVSQQTPHETFRLVEIADEYRLEGLLRGEWKGLYRFGLQEQFPIDYEVSNWYLSNHPESNFVTSLIAARVGEDCRHTLRNNEYAIHHLNEDTEKRMVKDVDDLELLLTSVFDIAIPDHPDARSIFKWTLDRTAGNYIQRP